MPVGYELAVYEIVVKFSIGATNLFCKVPRRRSHGFLRGWTELFRLLGYYTPRNNPEDGKRHPDQLLGP